MFVHLHLHTEYSLSGRRLPNQRACWIRRRQAGRPGGSDHGPRRHVWRGGFLQGGQEHAGYNPIIGCEVYVAQRTRFDKTRELGCRSRHLVLLCENEHRLSESDCDGFARAWTEGFYSKPRVDFELLEQYHEGLIALSACLAGEVPRALVRQRL